jgi:hypothetical protein
MSFSKSSSEILKLSMEKGSILKYLQAGGDREQKERSSKREVESIEKRKQCIKRTESK